VVFEFEKKRLEYLVQVANYLVVPNPNYTITKDRGRGHGACPGRAPSVGHRRVR